MAGLAVRDNILITPALRDGAPTSGPLDDLAMQNAGGYFTEPIDVGNFAEGIALIRTTGKGGTSPTLDCDLQYGFKDSDEVWHWVDSGDVFTQITANGLNFKKFSANFGKYIRFRLVIGGTATPTYTVTMRVALKG